MPGAVRQTTLLRAIRSLCKWTQNTSREARGILRGIVCGRESQKHNQRGDNVGSELRSPPNVGSQLRSPHRGSYPGFNHTAPCAVKGAGIVEQSAGHRCLARARGIGRSLPAWERSHAKALSRRRPLPHCFRFHPGDTETLTPARLESARRAERFQSHPIALAHY